MRTKGSHFQKPSCVFPPSSVDGDEGRRDVKGRISVSVELAARQWPRPRQDRVVGRAGRVGYVGRRVVMAAGAGGGFPLAGRIRRLSAQEGIALSVLGPHDSSVEISGEVMMRGMSGHRVGAAVPWKRLFPPLLSLFLAFIKIPPASPPGGRVAGWSGWACPVQLWPPRLPGRRGAAGVIQAF